jgi:anti-anti-sigma factor
MRPDQTPSHGGNPAEPTVEVIWTPETVPGLAAIVRLYGEHDVSTSSHVREALGPIYGDVLVDLSACEFIDSSVISVLLVIHQIRRREGHRLELLVPRTNSTIARTIQVAGLENLLTVHDADSQT